MLRPRTDLPRSIALGPVDVRRHAVIGAVLLVTWSVIGAGTVWLLPVSESTSVVSSAIFAATGLVGAASLGLRWQRLPHQVLLLYPVVGMGGLAALGWGTTGVGSTYPGFIVFSFIFMGFSGSIRGVLALLPIGAVTWVLLSGAPHTGMTVALGIRLAIAMFVWAAVGIVLAQRSLTEQQQRIELSDAARTDALTGLDNRRTLEPLLGTLVPGDVVVVVDIDEFREINSARGHGGGDAVLSDFGRTVKSGLRSGDHAIRQGGDEFVLMLTGVGDVQVLSILGRVRDRWRYSSGSVTFSAGAATVRQGETSLDALRRADRHCYQAKGAGRDQWVLDETDTADLPVPDAAAGVAPNSVVVACPAPRRTDSSVTSACAVTDRRPVLVRDEFDTEGSRSASIAMIPRSRSTG